MSKKKKGAMIILVVVMICLLGVLAFSVGKKMTTKNNSQTAPKVVNKVQSKKSEAQKKSASSASNGLENNLDDTDYYVLATIKGFNMNPPHVRMSLNSLNQDAQKWTVQGDCFRLGQQNDGKMGVIPNGNGAGYEFISIDKDSVTVAHMGGGKDDADNHWISQTFSKKELVTEYLKSNNDVNLLKQTVASLNRNNDAYKASVAQQKSEENVDTKNLTESQFKKWVAAAYNGNDYHMEFDDQNQYPEIHVYRDNGTGNAVIDVTYRVNGDGKLQKVTGFDAQPDDGNDWQDVDVPYPGD
ncbi:hypothetical protein [Ligilactobacillus aviarius]|uniref:hypothetical protein n=1 Tax=Ligilactobacillus aviarius TaxID=1606 RepID=UPI0024B967DF|nr:hypothetical protein [Ligilactobacillus aviarius]